MICEFLWTTAQSMYITMRNIVLHKYINQSTGLSLGQVLVRLFEGKPLPQPRSFLIKTTIIHFNIIWIKLQQFSSKINYFMLLWKWSWIISGLNKLISIHLSMMLCLNRQLTLRVWKKKSIISELLRCLHTYIPGSNIYTCHVFPSHHRRVNQFISSGDIDWGNLSIFFSEMKFIWVFCSWNELLGPNCY